jgi:hypothetical protein
VTVGGRYVLGIGAVATATVALSVPLAPAARSGVWAALGAALAVQGPLGWWLVRAIGSERFLLVWAVGIAARLATLTLAALVVAPWLGLALAPTLFTLAGVLMAFVAVEAIAVGTGRQGAAA